MSTTKDVLTQHRWISVLQDCSCHYGIPRNSASFFPDIDVTVTPGLTPNPLGSWDAYVDHVSEIVDAERFNSATLSEDVICHVLADIAQAGDEDGWSLQERLEVIQKICTGKEYVNGS